jgi:hypothetical protein
VRIFPVCRLETRLENCPLVQKYLFQTVLCEVKHARQNLIKWLDQFVDFAKLGYDFKNIFAGKN